jgi:hypothetical protein
MLREIESFKDSDHENDGPKPAQPHGPSRPVAPGLEHTEALAFHCQRMDHDRDSRE